MSKLKLRLAGLSFIALSLLVVGVGTASADCIDVIVWAGNPDTGECYQFPTPCAVPPGWTTYPGGCPY
ncbi:MAG TPA: hypothetical protein VGH73_25260 [Thermoanaerobaculia bacterium]|jgi:hypothetical protein